MKENTHDDAIAAVNAARAALVRALGRAHTDALAGLDDARVAIELDDAVHALVRARARAEE